MGTQSRWLVWLVPLVLSVLGCSERQPARDMGASDTAGAERSAASRVARLPARVDRARRIDFAAPMRFRGGGDEALETKRILLLKVAIDPVSFFAIGERQSYWFFNRMQVQLVGRSGEDVVLAVPDPGPGLPSAVLWQSDASVRPPSAADVRESLAEIGRGERPALHLGDGKVPRVEVGAATKVGDREGLQRQAAELLGKQQ